MSIFSITPAAGTPIRVAANSVIDLAARSGHVFNLIINGHKVKVTRFSTINEVVARFEALSDTRTAPERLQSFLSGAFPEAAITDILARPWSSTGFRGDRVTMTFANDTHALSEQIGDMEFDLPGLLIVDATVTQREADYIVVSFLTVEDR